jgi:hypothetical protein
MGFLGCSGDSKKSHDPGWGGEVEKRLEVLRVGAEEETRLDLASPIDWFTLHLSEDLQDM